MKTARDPLFDTPFENRNMAQFRMDLGDILGHFGNENGWGVTNRKWRRDGGVDNGRRKQRLVDDGGNVRFGPLIFRETQKMRPVMEQGQ